MFMLSWIRASDVSANANGASAEAPQNNNTGNQEQQQQQQQDDWVFLPSDHSDLMSTSVSNLDRLSSSMTLYPSTSSRHTHPAASRSRNSTTSSVGPANDQHPSVVQLLNHKSRRQLKQEQRRQQELEAMERRPRYDPMMAKLRDDQFKMVKLNKLGLRTGRILSSSTGGANSLKGQQRSSSSNAATGGCTSAPLKAC